MVDKDDESVTERMVDTHETERVDEHAHPLFIALFYFLGAACFVPNNFYITANEYWMYKFRDPSKAFNKSETVDKTTLQKNFTAYQGIASNIGMVVFLILTIVFSKKIPLLKRIIGSIFFLLVLFTFTLIFIFVDTDSWQEGFFAIALGIGGLLGASTSVLMISLFQLSSRFPPRCLAAQFSGQSACGILAAVIQVLALLVAPSVTGTASLYYSIASVVLASTLLAFILIHKTEDFQQLVEEKPKDLEDKGPKLDINKIKMVAKKLSLLIGSLILSVGISQMLNPGLTALVESSGKGTNVWSDTFFLPVCVFLSFNTFEFIGREMSNYFTGLNNKYFLFISSILRIVLLPLILLCNLQPRHNLPVVFHEDVYFIIFVILLAFSGGYLSNMVIIMIPSYCEKDEKMISTVLIVVLMIGFITLFSIIGGVIVSVL